MASRIKRLVPVMVNNVLDGHVKLTVDCLDRVYMHGTWAGCRSAGSWCIS
jgi:hypothetical protein